MPRSPSSHPLRRLLRGLRIPAIAWGALALFACTMADRLIFLPPRPGYTPEARALVRFDTAAGESTTLCW